MAFYDYESFAFFHRKAPPPVESHAIIEDYRGVVYTSSPMAAPLDEYASWPKKNITTNTTSTWAPLARPPPPPRQGQYYQQFPHYEGQGPPAAQMKKPGGAVLTSTEAVKIYRGVLITEYGTKKPRRPN